MHPSIFGIALYVWDIFWHLEDSRHGNLPHMTVNSGGDLGAGRWLDRQDHRYYTSTGITLPLRLHSLDSSLHSSQLQKVEWNDKILIIMEQNCDLYQRSCENSRQSSLDLQLMDTPFSEQAWAYAAMTSQKHAQSPTDGQEQAASTHIST